MLCALGSLPTEGSQTWRHAYTRIGDVVTMPQNPSAEITDMSDSGEVSVVWFDIGQYKLVRFAFSHYLFKGDSSLAKGQRKSPVRIREPL